MKQWLVSLLVLLILVAAPEVSHSQGEWESLEKEEKLLAVNALAGAGIVTYGVLFWEYGQRAPGVTNEGWFGERTKYGGSDKTGHAYSAYLAARLFSQAYQDWGFSREQAALYGGLSSLWTTGLIEVGDSFSDYGFSYEDMIMNTAGAAFGYLLEDNPSIARKLDLRIEYIPTGDESDILSDYSGMKHLLAVKGSGFDALDSTPLRYLELHLGYYTRGFIERDLEREQSLYAGVGLNVALLGSKVLPERYANFFKYYQAPYTYVPFEHEDRSQRD